MKKPSALAIRSAAWVMMFGSTLSGCAPKNPYAHGPDAPTLAVDLSGNNSQSWTPKADILFVVDDSLSMDAHQINVSKNIDGFVDAFKKNQILDYHIAVTQIFDHKKFGVSYNGRLFKDFSPIGAICPLKLNFLDLPKLSKNPNVPSVLHNPCDLTTVQTQPIEERYSKPSKFDVNQGCVPADHTTSYITRNTCDGLDALRYTLKMGTRQGPEFEEVFSPVLAVAQNVGGNNGFIRPDATLIVVFVTDADDGTQGLTPESFADALIATKGGRKDKVKLVGALSTIEDTKCETDPSGKPFRITTLLREFGTEPVSLCSPSFGAQLAKLGDDFSESISRATFRLDSTPNLDTLKVTYGNGQEIPRSYEEGYTFYPADNVLTISGHAKITPEPGGVFHINYDAANLKGTHITVIGTPDTAVTTQSPSN